MSIVSENFMQPVFRSMKLLRYTHTWTKLHKFSWAKSLVLTMSLFTWSELNYCAWFDGAVCEQPALVCHGSQPFSLAWNSLLNTLARVQIWNPLHPFVQFKFWYMATSKQADIHTYTRVLQCSRLSSPQLIVKLKVLLTDWVYILHADGGRSHEHLNYIVRFLHTPAVLLEDWSMNHTSCSLRSVPQSLDVSAHTR